MRLLLLSDVHSNLAALEAVLSEASRADAVAFAGDAVDYGPHPAGCVALLRGCANWAVRGNHDHALAFDTGCRCSPRFRAMSVASRAMNRERVSDDDRTWMGGLPLQTNFTFGGARFAMLHAAPADPMYHYLPEDADLEAELDGLASDADVVVLGHTHRPLLAAVGSAQVVNPGSVGQPKHGDPRAAYAVWEDGWITLHRISYPVEETVRDLEAAGLPGDIFDGLRRVLRTGR